MFCSIVAVSTFASSNESLTELGLNLSKKSCTNLGMQTEHYISEDYPIGSALSEMRVSPI